MHHRFNAALNASQCTTAQNTLGDRVEICIEICIWHALDHSVVFSSMQSAFKALGRMQKKRENGAFLWCIEKISVHWCALEKEGKTPLVNWGKHYVTQ